MKQSATQVQNRKRIQAAQEILDSLSEHIAVLDSAGNIITTNEAWDKFALKNRAIPLESVGVGKNYLEVCTEAARGDKRLDRIARKIQSVLEGQKGKFAMEFPCHSENGNRWLLVSVTPLKSEGAVSGAVVTRLDITRRKLAEMETKRLAVTDSMTGILNRKAGMGFVHFKIKKCRKHKTPLTVCYVDLDNLKYVNDNFGHKEGDKVIKTSVKIIKAALRETDVMCRMGGDEILVILPDTSLGESNSVIGRITSLVESKEINSVKPYKIQFSYGLAEYSPQKKYTAEELVDIADKNMYKMKAAKKRSPKIYGKRGN